MIICVALAFGGIITVSTPCRGNYGVTRDSPVLEGPRGLLLCLLACLAFILPAVGNLWALVHSSSATTLGIRSTKGHESLRRRPGRVAGASPRKGRWRVAPERSQALRGRETWVVMFRANTWDNWKRFTAAHAVCKAPLPSGEFAASLPEDLAWRASLAHGGRSY